jgi:hypothetical protein
MNQTIASPLATAGKRTADAKTPQFFQGVRDAVDLGVIADEPGHDVAFTANITAQFSESRRSIRAFSKTRSRRHDSSWAGFQSLGNGGWNSCWKRAAEHISARRSAEVAHQFLGTGDVAAADSETFGCRTDPEINALFHAWLAFPGCPVSPKTPVPCASSTKSIASNSSQRSAISANGATRALIEKYPSVITSLRGCERRRSHCSRCWTSQCRSTYVLSGFATRTASRMEAWFGLSTNTAHEPKSSEERPSRIGGGQRGRGSLANR